MTSLLIAAALAAAAQSSAPAVAVTPVPAEPAPAAPAPAAAPTAPAPATAPTAPTELRAAAGTVVAIELAELVASDKHPRGHRFEIRLAQPLEVDGVVLLPAGTPGVGEVVNSAKSGLAGKPGELTVAARFLTHNGATVPLRGMKLGRAGSDQTGAAFVASMVAAPLGFFVQGGEVVLPPGTIASAKLAADFVAPAPAAPATVAPPTPPADPSAAAPAPAA